MRNIITIIALIITSASFAQMKVTDNKKTEYELIGEYKLLGTSYAKIEKDGELCKFTYRDEKFTTMDNYKHFYFRYSDLDTLYGLLTNFDGIEKGSSKTVELEDGGDLTIRYEKMMGQMYVKVAHYDKAEVSGSIRDLTSKQFKKLFGKDK
jgi:hypothetical protein